jgi:hypothetical protein
MKLIGAFSNEFCTSKVQELLQKLIADCSKLAAKVNPNVNSC